MTIENDFQHSHQLWIERLFHAGYLIKSPEATIAFDPIFESPFSYNCLAFPEVEFHFENIKNLKLDAVFISHVHEDHFSLQSLNFLNKETPLYIFSADPRVLTFLKMMGFTKTSLLELNQSTQIKDLKITAYESLDADMDSILHLQYDNINILNVVDSWIPPHTQQKINTINWDLILWPFQWMREIEILTPHKYFKTKANFALHPEDNSLELEQYPEVLIDSLIGLNPRYLVASSCQFYFGQNHWKNSFYFAQGFEDFKKLVREHLDSTSHALECEIFNLKPSEALCIEKKKLSNTVFDTKIKTLKNESLFEVISLNSLNPDSYQRIEDNSDYSPDLNKKIPSLFEVISKQFAFYKKYHDKIYGPISCEYKNQLILTILTELNRQKIEIPLFEAHSIFTKWALIIYLSENEAQAFIFNFKFSQWELESESLRFQTETQLDLFIKTNINDQNPIWVTELTRIDLRLALEDGASLNSLEIRINDLIYKNNFVSFDNSLNAFLQDSTLSTDRKNLDECYSQTLKDPFLQICYSEDPLQYQKHQLIKMGFEL